MLKLLLLLLVTVQAVAAEKTNVFVLDVCSLRQDRITAASKNITALSKESLAFTAAWAQGSWCLPNFVTMQTGARPSSAVMAEGVISEKTKTMAEIMRSAGFKTMAFTGAMFMHQKHGLNRGFDQYEFSQGGLGEASFESYLPKVKESILKNKSSPMFTYITIDDLHTPYMADNRKAVVAGYKLFESMIFPNPSMFKDLNEKGLGAYPLLKTEMLNSLYNASVLRVDRLVGEFLDFLKAQNLYDSSMVILTADHGEGLGENGHFGHVTGVYEHILNIPLMIHDKAATPSVVTDPVERIDVPATILAKNDLLSANRAQFSGMNLLGMTKGNEYVFYVNRGMNKTHSGMDGVVEAAVRKGNTKLIWRKEKDSYEMYDLGADKEEKKNIISERSADFEAMKAKLKEHLATY